MTFAISYPATSISIELCLVPHQNNIVAADESVDKEKRRTSSLRTAIAESMRCRESNIYCSEHLELRVLFLSYVKALSDGDARVMTISAWSNREKTRPSEADGTLDLNTSI